MFRSKHDFMRVWSGISIEQKRKASLAQAISALASEVPMVELNTTLISAAAIERKRRLILTLSNLPALHPKQ
jgi:hypothetical protein